MKEKFSTMNNESLSSVGKWKTHVSKFTYSIHYQHFSISSKYSIFGLTYSFIIQKPIIRINEKLIPFCIEKADILILLQTKKEPSFLIKFEFNCNGSPNHFKLKVASL